jgi:hypothetical protein
MRHTCPQAVRRPCLLRLREGQGEGWGGCGAVQAIGVEGSVEGVEGARLVGIGARPMPTVCPTQWGARAYGAQMGKMTVRRDAPGPGSPAIAPQRGRWLVRADLYVPPSAPPGGRAAQTQRGPGEVLQPPGPAGGRVVRWGRSERSARLRRSCARTGLGPADTPGVGYSITSSARASSDCGTVRPSASAVLRLMTSSKVVARWTGRSAGLAPLRTFPA